VTDGPFPPGFPYGVPAPAPPYAPAGDPCMASEELSFRVQTETGVLAANIPENTPGTTVGSVINLPPILSALSTGPKSGTRWVVVYAIEEGGRPFDMRLIWTAAGSPKAGDVTVTAPRGYAQVTIFASNVDIQIGGWLNQAGSVFVVAAPTDDHPANQMRRIMRITGLGGGGVWQPLIPHYAQSVRVYCDTPALLNNVTVDFNAIGAARVLRENANAGRIDVPPAATITVTNNNPGALASVILDYELEI